jgi:glutamine phosphoribosylpyrophosphate amidotransferase
MSKTIDYDVVTQFSGHQPNRGVELVTATEDIFKRCKEDAMQCAINSEFIQFKTLEELQNKLEKTIGTGFTIRCFDEVVGG